MRLVIDFGNTLVKYYVFDRSKIVDATSTKSEDWQKTLVAFRTKHPDLEGGILSDVQGVHTEALLKALSPLPMQICGMHLDLPFQTRYQSPQQLGADRIALAAAACVHFPNQHRLVIDLGSCITSDFIDKNNDHWGGTISPGFGMRYKSLHQFSGKLPLLDFQAPKNPIGNSTAEAIYSGVYYGIINEVEGQIACYQQDFKDLTLILTGGDAERLPKPLKNSIFAHSNFLATGLNYILDLNTPGW